jgi:hypothetical protein
LNARWRRGNEKAAQGATFVIYTLDARLRGHDNKVSFRGNDDIEWVASAGMTTNTAEACPRMV